MSKKILIFPFGGNAQEAFWTILDINKNKQEWDVIGFIDDNLEHKGKNLMGVSVLGGREVMGQHPEAFVIAVPGNPDEYLKREQIIEGLKLDKKRFATIIHPTAVVSPDAVIGANTLLMAHVVVSRGVSVGEHCIVLPNTVISHHSVVGDYCCLGSNVSVSGSVKVGTNCYIGSGTSIRDKITIGEKSLVGLGSNVIEDVAQGVVVAGNPAKLIRKAQE